MCVCVFFKIIKTCQLRVRDKKNVELLLVVLFVCMAGGLGSSSPQRVPHGRLLGGAPGYALPSKCSGCLRAVVLRRSSQVESGTVVDGSSSTMGVFLLQCGVVCVVSHGTVLCTRRHPVHPVLLLIVRSREMQAVWSQTTGQP